MHYGLIIGALKVLGKLGYILNQVLSQWRHSIQGCHYAQAKDLVYALHLLKLIVAINVSGGDWSRNSNAIAHCLNLTYIRALVWLASNIPFTHYNTFFKLGRI